MDWVTAFAATCGLWLINLLWQTPIVWGFERLTSRYPVAAERQLRGLAFTIVVVPVSVAISMTVRNAARSIHPLFDLHAIPGYAGHPTLTMGASAALSILLVDFAYYWTHRLQHTWPLLWRFHAQHHAIRDLSALNNYAHWSETLVGEVFKFLPVFLMIRLYPGIIGLIAGVFVAIHQGYIHSTSRLNFGRWSWFISDNVRHRIHHSIERQHFDKNFGIEFGFWDHLFGTAYVPMPDEWPETGVREQAEAKSLKDYWLWPRHEVVQADHGAIHEVAGRQVSLDGVDCAGVEPGA